MPVSAHHEATPLDSVSIHGRKTELRQLLKALTLCRSGQGRAILVSGSEGIGKTALLQTFLDLAGQETGTWVTAMTCPSALTPARLFMLLLEHLLETAGTIITRTLVQANTILAPLGMHWSQSDLLRILSLMGLQESVGSRASLSVERLAQALTGHATLFGRRRPAMEAPMQALAQCLSNPLILMAVSLVNPLNPQVQTALRWVEQMGDPEALRLTRSFQMEGLLRLPGSTEGELALPEDLSTDVQEAVLPEGISSSGLQQALIDLFRFLNEGLKQHQATMVIALDQWEALERAPVADRDAVQGLFNELLRGTVEQRDMRLLFVLACRSEAQGDTLGAGLYNGLRLKYLVPPLAAKAQQRLLQEALSPPTAELPITLDEAVFREIEAVYRGNPALLNLLAHAFRLEATPGQPALTLPHYQERYGVRTPAELLPLLYARLQWSFIGQEERLEEALLQLYRQFETRPFRLTDAHTALADLPLDGAFVERLIQGLQRIGFLVSPPEAPADETTYRFVSAFVSPFLQRLGADRAHDLPTPDKIEALKKILPVSIASGELTVQKAQEMLAMAAALPQTDLAVFVEATFLSALQTTETPWSTRKAILQTLTQVGGEVARSALRVALESGAHDLCLAACEGLAQAAPTTLVAMNLPPDILEALSHLLTEDDVALRRAALAVIARLPDPTGQWFHAMQRALDDPHPDVRQTSLESLLAVGHDDDVSLTAYAATLESGAPTALVQHVLDAMPRLAPEAVVPMLQRFLTAQPKTHPLWMRALQTLAAVDITAAWPQVDALLVSHTESDQEGLLILLKHLGGRPHDGSEQRLVRFLGASQAILPEQRWMAMRSLGRIGKTPAARKALEAQAPWCQIDPILERTRRIALVHVQAHLPPEGSLSFPVEVLPPESGNGVSDAERRALTPATV